MAHATGVSVGSILANEYSEVCINLGVTVDAALLACLDTDWNHLICSSDCSLLPLLKALENTAANKKLKQGVWSQIVAFRLYHHPHRSTTWPNALADSNARVLRQILEKCTNIKFVDLTRAGLGNNGLLQIGYGVKTSKSLQKLKLRGNKRAYHAFGNKKFVANLLECRTLTHLDISENNLDFSVTSLYKRKKSEEQEELQVETYGNFPYEEVLNAVTHGVGALLAILGSMVLLSNAMHKDRTVFYACVIYCFTVIFLYISSSIYHSSFGNKHLSSVLSIFDHCAIFLMIAGGYTPFCMVSLRNHHLGVYVALAEWLLAFFGIVLTLLKKKVSIPFHDAIELCLYVGMGNLIYVVYEDVFQVVDAEAVMLLQYGGFAYMGGVVFFLLDHIHPVTHVIWHLFVMAGSVFHYFAVLWYVVGFHDETQ